MSPATRASSSPAPTSASTRPNSRTARCRPPALMSVAATSYQTEQNFSLACHGRPNGRPHFSLTAADEALERDEELIKRLRSADRIFGGCPTKERQPCS